MTSNLEILFSNDIGTTVRPISSSVRGSASIEASFDTRTEEKNIHIGKPERPLNLFGPQVVNTGALVRYFGTAAAGATSHEWRLPYPYDVVTDYNYSGRNWQMRRNSNHDIHEAFTGYGRDDGYIQLFGKNECGNGGGNGGGPTTGGAIPLVGNPNSYIPSSVIAIAPNPASFGNLSFGVVPVTSQNESQPTTMYRILIYDQNSNGIVDYNYQGGTEYATFSVPDVPSGSYIAVIATDIGYVGKQLLIGR